MSRKPIVYKLKAFKELSNMYRMIREDQANGNRVMIAGEILKNNIS